MLSHAWVIPFVPLVASILILFFGKRLPRRGSEIGIASMAATLALTLWAVVEWINSDRTAQTHQVSWFTFGNVHVDVGTLMDGLTITLLFLVAVISLAVQVYSTEYMKRDGRYTHYFAVLTMFTAAMDWFVMSSNTLQMIFGWEMMSVCSFLLIAHWWEEPHNVRAALKAFFTTRFADIGLFIGVIVLFFAQHKSFDINALNAAAMDGQLSHDLLLVGAIGLLIAVIGKSAQFPLHTWLPDAMAGPTPISAMIHAATMVVAGVYLLARLFPVFAHAFSISAPNIGINPVALVGGVTVIVAALLAFVQTDVKRVLAYSTVSQLGYMVMAIGVGAWTAGTFHLLTHAFFKALLFLAAGSVSHVVHGFDIEKDMGGLRKKMPITHATFAIGAASLVGIIPLSGFWSKEQITAQAGTNGYEAFQVVALVGAFLTAAYMMRCYYLMFCGEHRGHSVLHESPLTLTVPCIALAVVSLAVGFLQAPLLHIGWFGHFLGPNYAFAESSGISLVFVLELVLTAAGIGAAWFALTRKVSLASLAQRNPLANFTQNVLHNRLYLDWLYERVFVRGTERGLAQAVSITDSGVIDNFVNQSSASAQLGGTTLGRVQNGRVQRYAMLMVAGVVAITVVIAVVT